MAGEGARDERVDLIHSHEASLRSRERHRAVHAAELHRNSGEVAAKTESGAEEEQKDLFSVGPKINRHGHEAILPGVEPGYRLEALRAVCANAQRDSRRHALPV